MRCDRVSIILEAASRSLVLPNFSARITERKMKRISLLLFTVTLVWTSPLSAAPPPPEKLLASDTLGFVSVPDWTAGVAALRQNPYGRLWSDPVMRPFRERFLSRFAGDLVEPLEKELGLNLTNVSRLFEGQVTLAFTPGSNENKPGKSGFIFVADTGSRSAELASSLAQMRKKWIDDGKQTKPAQIRGLEFSTLRFEAAEVSRILDKILPNPAPPQKKPAEGDQEPELAEWTIGRSDSLLLISDSPKAIEKLLVLQAGGALPALADVPAYASEAPAFRQAQLAGWFNIKAIFDRLDQKQATSEGDAEESGASLITLSHFFGALGFTSVRTLAFDVQQNTGGSLLTLRGQVPESGRKGLFKILALESKESGPPPFVPADAVKFSRMRLNLPQAWNNLEAMLAEVSPPAASFLKFIIATAGKDKDPNFDFRESLLARMGDDLITYEKAPRSSSPADYDSPPSLVLLGARNADQMAAAFRAVTSILPPQLTKYKEREFLGRTIYSFTLPTPPGAGLSRPATLLNYAASGGYVAFSSDASMVEEFLRSSAGNGRSLREQPHLAEAAQKAGGMTTGFFSYENTDAAARAFFETARHESFNAAALLRSSNLGNRFGLGQGDSILNWFDFALLPAYERVARYFYFEVGALNVTTDAYTFKLFAPTPPALRN